MAGLGDVLNWLRGPQPTPSLGLEKAPPLQSYPSQYDADYARNYGFGDNSTNEDYLNNNKAQILGVNLKLKEPSKKGAVESKMFVPMSGADVPHNTLTVPTGAVDLNQRPDLQGDVRNMMMQAALAANRSPIAAMGFDPARANVDVAIKNPSLGGLYNPNNDGMYTTKAFPSSILHESTHRGIERLREKYPEQANPILNKLPDEEYVVRWLMQDKGGDPEKGLGDLSDKQRQVGRDMFANENWPASSGQNRELLNQLEELAIKDRLTRSRRSGPQ